MPKAKFAERSMSERLRAKEVRAKCTIGKDGKKYYFVGGKRVSEGQARTVGSEKCKAPKKKAPKKRKPSPVKKAPKRPKSSPVKKPAKKVKTPQRRRPKLKGDERYVWSVESLLIPVDRHVVVPKHHVYTEDKKQFASVSSRAKIAAKLKMDRKMLVYTDEETHNALKIFEEQRLGWGEEEWNTYLRDLFPHVLLRLRQM